jgi:hypothetical protein
VLGDRHGAGTDANVFIHVFGANGDSGERKLDAPDANLFERGHTDVFGLEAVDLGDIKKIILGHDNAGVGPGWFVDKVVVENESSSQKWFFLIGKWFDKKEEDGAIVREIPASTEDGVACAPLVRYKVSVITGDRPGAGTDANVFVTLFGSTGNSGKRTLDGPGNLFERAQTDVFGIECVDLGTIQK